MFQCVSICQSPTCIQKSCLLRRCSGCGFSCSVEPGCALSPPRHHRWSSSMEQLPLLLLPHHPSLTSSLWTYWERRDIRKDLTLWRLSIISQWQKSNQPFLTSNCTEYMQFQNHWNQVNSNVWKAFLDHYVLLFFFFFTYNPHLNVTHHPHATNNWAHSKLYPW